MKKLKFARTSDKLTWTQISISKRYWQASRGKTVPHFDLVSGLKVSQSAPMYRTATRLWLNVILAGLNVILAWVCKIDHMGVGRGRDPITAAELKEFWPPPTMPLHSRIYDKTGGRIGLLLVDESQDAKNSNTQLALALRSLRPQWTVSYRVH
jgi:hypothetical protein